MTRLLPRAVVLGLLVVLGWGLGYYGRRILHRLDPPTPAVERPAALEAAWRAYERGDREAFAQAIRDMKALELDATWAAERELLPLLDAGDRARLRVFVERHESSPASAAALDRLHGLAESDEERAVVRRHLERLHPRAWRLAPTRLESGSR